ncbi:Repeat domain-containing protein [Mariniphaga anaerophila]|uniref:Repeat domain-containing protein n=1 Tax=Mariniphaga anaerophila TaxID=1484053 RepID=A0A1M5EYT7_9BACT|nr:VCBS repeat-containing protein [Mariniphaga anaerophila]SHF84316.1 Repeat domain-containing protein [Mariniphaga anaerophila]
MKNKLLFLYLIFFWFFFLPFMSISQQLERLSYNNPDLLVDLGVGLWAWPLPMDYNDDGLIDLVVVCTDTPYNGVYYFENSGDIDADRLPIFKSSKRIGDGVRNVRMSYHNGVPLVTTPGKLYKDFKVNCFNAPESIPADNMNNIIAHLDRIRANQWQLVDFNGNGILDLLVGVGIWGPRDYRGSKYYGWDNAYNKEGQWTNGPIRGYLYLSRNEGSNDNPVYDETIQLFDTDGTPLEVFGMPSPSYADFNGDGNPDILCGEFRDGFTFFENVGTIENPLFATGRPLTNGDQIIRMGLCMITPIAFDFTGNGWPDLIVGDEDGRVALIEHTGEIIDGMPVFLQPRYFKQQADKVKFGALATPVGYDWNGDGLDDIITGNTAGHIAFIKNLGGTPVKWDAPKLLESDGEVIKILAGSNGSIQGPAEAKWGYTTLSVADWNHNGLPDLIVNSIWGKVVWYENVGTLTNPKLKSAQPIEVKWEDRVPKPQWNWWNPKGDELVTQWRTTPVAIDWNGDGLTDLVMLDHEGYLSLFRRKKEGDNIILLPGERVFRLKEKECPLRLNEKEAGGSGRRKISIADFDNDGRLDLLLNSQNATFFRNIGMENGITTFEDMGLLDDRKLAGHTSSPTVINLTGKESKDLLIGAEDGYLYYRINPYSK